MMLKALIIKNELSGSSNKVSLKAIKEVFCNGYDVNEVVITCKNIAYDVEGFDRIIVSGGDGTFSNFLNLEKKAKSKAKEIFYISSGTLNEKTTNCKNISDSKDGSIISMNNTIGVINDTVFSYVLATGTFTPLGYITSSTEKKKYKYFAYIHNVLSEYRVHHIKASLDFNGQNIHLEDTYAIIMFLLSGSCFKLNFNKMYRKDDSKLYLLTIKAPKRKDIFGKIKLFFALFRAFFIGFKKEKRSKVINFLTFKEVKINLSKDEPFCCDGELLNIAKGDNYIVTAKTNSNIKIIDAETLDELYKEHKCL